MRAVVHHSWIKAISRTSWRVMISWPQPRLLCQNTLKKSQIATNNWKKFTGPKWGSVSFLHHSQDQTLLTMTTFGPRRRKENPRFCKRNSKKSSSFSSSFLDHVWSVKSSSKSMKMMICRAHQLSVGRKRTAKLCLKLLRSTQKSFANAMDYCTFRLKNKF